MKKALLAIWLFGRLFGCDYEEAPIRNSDVIKDITFDKVTLEADGFSRTTVTVELPFDAEVTKRTVDFSTTSGTFAESDGKNTASIVAVQDEITTPFRLFARATLISPQAEGKATVTAKVSGYAQPKSYSFTTAYPEGIVITPSLLLLKQGAENEVNITVTLTRQVGKPSLNRPVELLITNPAGIKVGRFREEKSQSDASGKCYFTYTLGPDKYLGKLLIKASTDKLPSKTDTLYTQ